MIIKTDSHVEAYRQRALHLPEFMSGRSVKATQETNLYISGVIGKPAELLDVGCGDATLLAMISAPRSAGIAPTDTECELLRRRYPNFSFLEGTAQQIPLADKTFDTVVCNGVLLLLASNDELRMALRELRRVARRQLYVGEMPYRPEAFNQDISTPMRYVASNFKKSLRHGLSAAKTVALSMIGRHTFIAEPNQLVWATAADMQDAVGLKADFVGEHSPGRYDYLFRLD